MNHSDFLVQAAIYIASAIILVPIFKRLGLGSVLGYLIAGILIGPFALKLIDDPEHMLHFAEFGVVLMLFLIGLELESQKVWELRKLLFGLGGMQVTVTATFERQEGRRVYATMRAVSELGDELGNGRTTQVILPQARIDANFEDLRGRWNAEKAARSAP